MPVNRTGTNAPLGHRGPEFVTKALEADGQRRAQFALHAGQGWNLDRL
jgi:hypothetical protein